MKEIGTGDGLESGGDWGSNSLKLRAWRRASRRKKGRVIKIQKGDLEILSALEKWGVLGLGQIEGLLYRRGAATKKRTALFFNKAGRWIYDCYSYKRLRLLGKAGLIRPLSLLNYPRFYCLSELGHDVLRRRGRARCEGFRRSITENSLQHEVLVNGVGMIIQEVLGRRVTTERERAGVKKMAALSHGQRLVLSDLWVPDGERPRAIEVERSQKSQKSYRAIWKAYERRMWHRFPEGAVLYLVVGMPVVRKRFLKFARDWRMPFVYFAGIEDFIAADGRCRFTGYRDSLEFPRCRQQNAQIPPSYPRTNGDQEMQK